MELIRVLTLKDVVAVGLGAIIGAGIFVVTGVAAGVSGPAFILALLIAGLVAAFNALSSAQLAAVYPQSGGTYEYGYQLLNSWFGFFAGWMFLISKLSAAGIVAMGFGSYFSQLFPQISATVFSFSTVVLLTVANLMGIKKAGLLNILIVSVTLFALLFLIFSGISNINTENYTPFAPYGLKGIAEATAILFFAFTGYARIATLAEEVKDPEKTIPRAIILTIVSAILLYLCVALVALGVLGYEQLASTKSPLQLVAEKLNTPGLNIIITLGASTAMLGVLLSQILGISRMLYAMGRKGDLPPLFSRIHQRTNVPHIGILFTGIVILLLVILGSFEFVVRAATFTILLYYGITNLAAIKQPTSQQLYGKIIPVLGLMGCVVMAFSLPSIVIISGVILLTFGFFAKLVFNKLIR